MPLGLGEDEDAASQAAAEGHAAALGFHEEGAAWAAHEDAEQGAGANAQGCQAQARPAARPRHPVHPDDLPRKGFRERDGR